MLSKLCYVIAFVKDFCIYDDILDTIIVGIDMKKMVADFYALQNTPKNNLYLEKADGNAFPTIEYINIL